MTVVVEATQTRQFYRLNRSMQERILLSLSGSGVPVPLAASPRVEPSLLPNWLLAAGGIGGAVAGLSLGFGQLGHELAIQPWWYAMGAAAGMGAGAYLALRTMTTEQRRQHCPEGSYLLPNGVLTVDKSTLTLHKFRQDKPFELSGKKLTAHTIAGGSYRFSVSGGEAGEALLAAAAAAREAANQAELNDDRKKLILSDIFYDSQLKNPFSSTEAVEAPRTKRTLHLASALLFGLLMGGASWWGRNQMSVRTLYRTAVEQDTPKAYRAYLDSGAATKDVSSLRLPRALLRECKGKAACLEAFIAERQESAILGEIQQDLLEALRAELLVAKAEGTLAALESFKKSFPHFEMVTDELAFARAQIFKRALEQGLERLSEDESLRQSLRDIYARLESEGPVVLFQFKELPSESHERVDVSVRSSTYYVGRVNVPSQYFQGDYLRGRELQLAKELMPKFSELGTDELLQLQLKTSEQVLSDEEEKLPRIVIEHSTDFGDKYENKFPPGVFVGLAINFRVLIYPSSGEASYTYRTSFWIPPNFTDYRENKWSVPELYEQMTLRSRTGFLQRFAKAAWAPVEEMPAEAEAVKAPASVIDAQTAEVPVTQE